MNESVSKDEWNEILRVMLTLKPNFEDYDEYSSPSILSEFRIWSLESAASALNGTVKNGDCDDDDGDW